ncbi:voltage-gated potassium channel [Coniophora puteana RWD-64-598 SS2]|uniref:Voltage-gated potassium channel n=1 Tax=Coniophora puteana (strain RWD-64-598) TaxID=741705 RepID=R7SFQ1_CONPW|nr:voltage-gated potassium channel [Coniophora puteana RWD-64-598 SS2]EIW74567.1 voltage-gated potassium channel [Coniophora puteana RWD-64-598 SS2]
MANEIRLSRLRSPNGTTSRFTTEDIPPPTPTHIEDIFQSSSSTTLAPPDPAVSPWKRTLFDLLEEPTSSPGAFLVHVLTTSLIVISALVTILETVPSFHGKSFRVWFGLETSLVVLFTIEYVARCFAWSATWMGLAKWMFSFYGVVDMLAILPYYIELILQQDTSALFRFSILRMFRLLRVFRPFRHNSTLLLTIEVMYLAIRRSQHALLALSFFIFMVLTVFSTLLYFTERGTWDDTIETFVNSDGDPTQFSSIPVAAWFVLVTITTVGYGEITPRSFLGKLITIPLLAFGLLLIALPSFVLGREFSIVWNEMTRQVGNIETGSVPDTPRERDPISDPFLGTISSLSHYGHGHGSGSGRSSSDLSNRKLAHNQVELSHQIADLRALVEAQSEVIRDLAALLSGHKAKADPNSSSGDLAAGRSPVPPSKTGAGYGLGMSMSNSSRGFGGDS